MTDLNTALSVAREAYTPVVEKQLDRLSQNNFLVHKPQVPSNPGSNLSMSNLSPLHQRVENPSKLQSYISDGVYKSLNKEKYGFLDLVQYLNTTLESLLNPSGVDLHEADLQSTGLPKSAGTVRHKKAFNALTSLLKLEEITKAAEVFKPMLSEFKKLLLPLARREDILGDKVVDEIIEASTPIRELALEAV